MESSLTGTLKAKYPIKVPLAARAIPLWGMKANEEISQIHAQWKDHTLSTTTKKTIEIDGVTLHLSQPEHPLPVDWSGRSPQTNSGLLDGDI